MAKCKKNQAGFTLLQLVIVISIIAILAVIAIPSYLNIIAKAKTTKLEYNRSVLKSMMTVYGTEFTADTWYGAWNTYADGSGDYESSLNNYLEYIIEVMDDGAYSNGHMFENPYSGGRAIVDHPNWPVHHHDDSYQAAIFLTADSAFSHTGGSSNDALIGTIVAYFNVSSGVTEEVTLYYVDEDGQQSDASVIEVESFAKQD